MYKSPGTFQSNHINISVNMLSSFLPVIREKAPVCTVNQMYSLFKNLTLLNISFHVPLPFNSQPLPVTWILPIGFKIYSNLYHWRKTHLTMITVFLIFFLDTSVAFPSLSEPMLQETNFLYMLSPFLQLALIHSLCTSIKSSW